jgi:hypothetical protein
MALDGDSPQTLLARADCALYSAKACENAAVFQHNGQHVEPVTLAPSYQAAADCEEDAADDDESVVKEPSGCRRAADAEACCGQGS